MSSNTSINQHALQSLLTKVPVIMLNFVAGIFLVRLLGTEGKGVHAYLLANVELAFLLLGFNVHLGITYFTAKNKESAVQIAGMALCLMLLALFIFGGILLVLSHFSSPLLRLFLPKEHQEPFFAFVLFGLFAISFANNLFIAFLQGYKHFGAINLLYVLVRLISCAVYAAAFFLQHSGEAQFTLHQIFTLVLSVEAVNLLLTAIIFFPPRALSHPLRF